MTKTTLATATVSNGRATTTTQLASNDALAGNKTLYAVYQENDYYMIGTGTNTAQIRIPVTVSIPQTLLVSKGEQNYTITAEVEDYAGNAVGAGSVTFYLGENTLASEVTLNSSGQATFQANIPSTITDGTVLTAHYSGTGIYELKEATKTVQVRGDSNVVVLPSTQNKISANRGDTITITATITDSDTQAIDEGTAQLKIDGNTVGTAQTVDDGAVSFTYTINSEMAYNGHTITVEYLGGTNYDPSSGTGQLIVRVPTTITVNSPSVNPGETVALVATVTPTSGSMNTSVASRTVKFYVGDDTTGQTAVLDTVNGVVQASIDYTADSDADGTETFYAVFQQDADFITSTSSEGTITFRKGVNVSVDSLYGLIGSEITLGATVTDEVTGNNIDSGSVTFELDMGD